MKKFLLKCLFIAAVTASSLGSMQAQTVESMRKTHYIYYPANNVYYNTSTKQYIVPRENKWYIVNQRPTGLQINPQGKVTLAYSGYSIQKYNDIHRKKYGVTVAPATINVSPGGADKTRYYYYPGDNIYYNVNTRQYIIMRNGKWVAAGRLPANVHLNPAGRVTLLYNGNNIYKYNAAHKSKYKVIQTPNKVQVHNGPGKPVKVKTGPQPKQHPQPKQQPQPTWGKKHSDEVWKSHDNKSNGKGNNGKGH
jgi:hypothetical protein